MSSKIFTWFALVWTMLLPACAQVGSGMMGENQEGFGGDSATGSAAGTTGGAPTGTGGAPSTGGNGPLATGGSWGSGGGSGDGDTPATGGGSGGLQPVADCTLNSECNDLSACTTDVCSNGTCAYNDNGSCECKAATVAVDCGNGNECITYTCQDNQCVAVNSTSACEDDGDVCTTDVCSAGTCIHPDSGTCGSNTFVLRSMRDAFAGQWVSLNPQSALVWNAASSLAQAELFDKEDISTNTFKMKALSNGKYVILGAAATIQATGDEVGALVFQATDCPLMGGSGAGLQNTAGGSFVKAEGSGLLISNGTGCNAANDAAWERFEFIAAGN